MTLSKGEEIRLAVLLSIIDVGGSGTKRKVLDNIQDEKYLNLTPEDFKKIPIGESSEEPKWRNVLAWYRNGLKKEGYISNSKRNDWRITESGKDYFFTTANYRLKNLAMIERLANENKMTFILTRNFYEKVKALREINLKFDSGFN